MSRTDAELGAHDSETGPEQMVGGDRSEDQLRWELEVVDHERLTLRRELERIHSSRQWRARERLREAAKLANGLRGTRSSDLLRALRRPKRRMWRPLRHRATSPRRTRSAPAGEWLTPVLVDYFSRDGSTLMMRLLGSSAEVATDLHYPFERRYFGYLWRWARLLDRSDWPTYLWANRDLASLGQERHLPLVGPPPWKPRELLDGARGTPPLSAACFDHAWREFSSRATGVTRRRHDDPDAHVRFYAEKHLNTWEVQLDQLPPVKVVALLRDPRDVYVSIKAFSQRDPARFRPAGVGSDEEQLEHVIDRSRRRLRWIAGLMEEDSVPVVRFEDLVRDLPGVAARLERWLGVRLDAEAVLEEQRIRRRHSSSDGGEASLSRWRSELDAPVVERFERELGPELRAVGIES